MPTGAGKSLCFQAPALLLQGTTLVISPLISLMKDQVDALHDMGIPAAFINSALHYEELREITSRARAGYYKLLYIAPERLELDSFRRLLSTLDVSLVAVDEAHCISQWGHDFRPSYLQISPVIKELPRRPVIAAFTATATPQVKEDIAALLRLENPFTLVTGFDRENLYFEVDEPHDKFKYLTGFLNRSGAVSGIIYCATRKTVENVCAKLNQNGFPCTRYHAGLSDEERTANQEAFINDDMPIIAATNAFGMGIDKSNIRYVLHYNMPKTMENYYQEAGRAGRDGETAQCVLLFGPADIITNKHLIELGENEAVKRSNYRKLQEIIDYCHTGICLRRYILDYFGEEDIPDDCPNCSNCLNTVNHTDITLEAQKILSCIKRTGQRFGSGMIVDVLKGAKTARIAELGFDKLSTYNIMPDYAKETIREIISFLVAQGLIDVRGEKYPVLFLNRDSFTWLNSNETLAIKRLIRKEEPGSAHASARRSRTRSRRAKDGAEPDVIVSDSEQALFEHLRTLRKEIAAAQRVPPYIVFSDATLRDMCRKRPVDTAAMLAVSGVGAKKLEKYGDTFIAAIRDHHVHPDRTGG